MLLSFVRFPERQRSFVSLSVVESGATLRKRLIAMKYIQPISFKQLALTAILLLMVTIVGIIPWQLVAQPISHTTTSEGDLVGPSDRSGQEQKPQTFEENRGISALPTPEHKAQEKPVGNSSAQNLVRNAKANAQADSRIGILQAAEEGDRFSQRRVGEFLAAHRKNLTLNIKAEFIRLPESEACALGFDVSHSFDKANLKQPSVISDNLLVGRSLAAVTAILTPDKRKHLIESIISKDGVDILTAPSLTVLNSQEAEIRVHDQRPVVFGPGQNTRQEFTGPSISVFPYVYEDGYSIHLEVYASVREFLGYDYSVKHAAPHFRNRSISTRAIVYDGQTLLIFGGLVEEILRIRMPVLGGLPITSRKFRSHRTVREKAFLMILVTATLIDSDGNEVHSAASILFNREMVPHQSRTISLPYEEYLLDSFQWLPEMNGGTTHTVPNCVLAPEFVPTYRILPEDVVQDSIRQHRFKNGSFAVRWTYTEAGAKKFLAFREEHAGQIVRTGVGNFQTPPNEQFQPRPPSSRNYSEWKKGWLKRRTSKNFGVSEAEAKAITAGLKGK